jgi:hypothetical protein
VGWVQWNGGAVYGGGVVTVGVGLYSGRLKTLSETGPPINALVIPHEMRNRNAAAMTATAVNLPGLPVRRRNLSFHISIPSPHILR